MGFEKLLRVNHGNNEFARGNVHVNGIESFWSYAERRLVQSMACPGTRSICILRKRRTASIIAIKAFIMPCQPCSETTRFDRLCFLNPLFIEDFQDLDL